MTTLNQDLTGTKGRGKSIKNTNIEIRNSKQIRMTKMQNSKAATDCTDFPGVMSAGDSQMTTSFFMLQSWMLDVCSWLFVVCDSEKRTAGSGQRIATAYSGQRIAYSVQRTAYSV